MRTEIIMPQMGESIVEGTVVEWLKKPGDVVERDEELFEISTDKVQSVIPSPSAGFLAAILVPAGEKVAVGTVVAILVDTAEEVAEVAGSEVATSAPKASAAPPTPPASGDSGGGSGKGSAPKPKPLTLDDSAAELRRTRSTPLVRRIASEHNVDISKISGTGLSGRVTKKDILAFIKSGGADSAAAPAPVSSQAPTIHFPEVPVGPNDRTETLTVMRQNIAEHMVMSRRVSAHCQTVHECDVTHIEALRRKHKQAFLAKGIKLSFTSFLVRAVSDALRTFPLMNASLSGNTVVYRNEVNVGVAVALEQGLIVPVVRNADDLTMSGISRSVADISSRARSKKLQPEDVQGGTFTISNAGIFGSLFGIPIINQPQVGILGVGGIHKRVRVLEDDSMAVRSIVTFCLTFDHRLVDGSVADGFMNKIKDVLENFAEDSL